MFCIKEAFYSKDGQTDFLFKLSMKTEVSEMFHFERVEALLFVETLCTRALDGRQKNPEEIRTTNLPLLLQKCCFSGSFDLSFTDN